MAATSERRLSPRGKLRLDCGIIDDSNEVQCLTYDLSARGLSCLLPREIPLFTKVRVVLQIPDKQLVVEEEEETREIQCEGVVVRRERADEENSKYKTAIFFSRINPNDADRLSDYVARGN